MPDLTALLKQYFGHDEFRPGQRALIEALLAGRDALGVMPTGAGKSVCYQLPALALPGVTLVISPLISLMQDQVSALREMGLMAVCIHSGLSGDAAREAYRLAGSGMCRLVYAAPERLAAPAFLRFCQAADIRMVAVDEAHCVSQWGQDFRPSYLGIADFIDGLPARPAVGAFTATATERVRADIERLLRLRDPCRVTTGFDRPNLFFEVLTPRRKQDALLRFLRERPGQSGIVYCATRKTVEDVCQALLEQGWPAARYHAGLSDDERRRNQEDFVFDRARIMVATNAFGMGIDKSNVSFVVHYNMPKDLESYYQEAGRAGRDGAPARCALLFSPRDVATARFLIEHSAGNEAMDPADRDAARDKEYLRLRQMTDYCKATDCLRGRLLRYFGEDAPARCGNCGNCLSAVEARDITVEAQKILSAVARVERRCRAGLGADAVARLLKGARNAKLARLNLDDLPTFGALSGASLADIRLWIDRLADMGYLAAVGSEFPVLRLTDAARRVLFEGERVVIEVRHAPAPAKPARRRKGAPEAEDGLFEALRALRMELARREGVPPYMVFSNAALAEMALARPRTAEAFLGVSGVGRVKARKYGPAFLAAIAAWEEGRGEPGS